MTKISLKAEERKEIGKKTRKFRREGKIPAVMYGHGIKNLNLWVNQVDFRKVFSRAGENSVIELDLGEKEKSNVIIHDVQADPYGGTFTHVDFFSIRMDEKIETEIPLEFVGESAAIKEHGGILIKSMEKIPVSCLPLDLPAKIEADISKIKSFDDHLKVSDLVISEKVKVLAELDSVVASVEKPRTDEELAQLNEKVEEDVTKVEGVVKEVPQAEPEKKEEK